MSSKDQIIKMITDMTGKYSAYNIFYDWCECMTLSISNSIEVFHSKLWKSREDTYKSIIRKYSLEEQKKFTEMFVWLGEAYEEKIEDVLGDIYMKSGCYSKQLGQFFTPYHLARMAAELGSGNIKEDEIHMIYEPSVGGGANIIGLADVLRSRGINYQKCIKVVAQDLDWLAVYMSYVQFSLLGIDAIVVQGDTLGNPYTGRSYPMERVFYTPKHKRAI